MHKYFAIPHVHLWTDDVCSQCTGRQRQYYGNNTILFVLIFENASQLKTKGKQPVSHGTQQIEIISIPIIENWSEVNYFNVRVCVYVFFLAALHSISWIIVAAIVDLLCYWPVVVSFKSFQLIKNMVSVFQGFLSFYLSLFLSFLFDFYSFKKKTTCDSFLILYGFILRILRASFSPSVPFLSIFGSFSLSLSLRMSSCCLQKSIPLKFEMHLKRMNLHCSFDFCNSNAFTSGLLISTKE